MIEKFLDWLVEPGSFLRNCILFFLLACSFPAFVAAFNEHRPVAAFAETFFAWVAYCVAIFGSFALGVFYGMKVAKKSVAAGWVAGILIFFSVGFGILFVAEQIPGVGWRIEKIMEDAGSDY